MKTNSFSEQKPSIRNRLWLLQLLYDMPRQLAPQEASASSPSLLREEKPAARARSHDWDNRSKPWTEVGDRGQRWMLPFALRGFIGVLSLKQNSVAEKSQCSTALLQDTSQLLAFALMDMYKTSLPLWMAEEEQSRLRKCCLFPHTCPKTSQRKAAVNFFYAAVKASFTLRPMPASQPWEFYSRAPTA